MSSDAPPEFFLDRSLGKLMAVRLRAAGHVVHLPDEIYPADAEAVPDAIWIAEGCRRGWILLTKDKRIRYRSQELAALDGYLFCLADGRVTAAAMTARLQAAIPRIVRAVARQDTGFWHIYADGSITRMWPSA